MPKPRGASRMVRSRVNRRNTMDCALLNQLIIEDDETKKANDKRATQLLRDSERDMKLSMGLVGGTNVSTANVKASRHSFGPDDRVDSLPLSMSLTSGNIPIINSTLIESSNRFMSVSSRPVGCRMSAPPTSFNLQTLTVSKFTENKKKEKEPKLPNRQEFHETFSNLIKLGSIDKENKNCRRTISREEYIWQTELKDLIWLELQAWHADRTLEQQDKYLLSARQNVGDLLIEIMNFKFRASYIRATSSASTDGDSGIATDSSSANSTADNRLGSPNIDGPTPPGVCTGCLSMYCQYCLGEQSRALKQVEILLTRLEAAESLYPSSKAFGDYYPMYRDSSFVARVKAMCLWYNITRHHRLKLLILGKLLTRLQGKKFQWPIVNPTSHIDVNNTHSSSSSSAQEDSGRDTIDSSDNNNAVGVSKPIPAKTPTKVHFNVEEPTDSQSDNPSESASSTESSKDTLFDDSSRSLGPPVGEFGKMFNDINMYNVQPLTDATYTNASKSTSPYRKYIENVLKSKGLGKSLSFLHRLHNVVLRKAHITLEKPGTEDIESEMDVFDDDQPYIETPIEKEEVDELRKYGAWSEEAKELALPSYVPAFIFLSLIPLEVIHEFLRMRLETKPLKPNPLSLEQLMKELREGLTLALIHRDRFNKHISTALFERETEMENYIGIMDEFDNTVKSILEVCKKWFCFRG